MLAGVILMSSCGSRKNILFNTGKEQNIPNVPVYELQKGEPSSNDKDQVLQPGDTFTITNLKNQTLITGLNPDNNPISNTNLEYTVKKNGEAELPLLGKVKLGGLTIDEAEEAINLLYREKLLTNDSQLVLSVTNMKVFLLGEFNSKGEILIDNNVNLTEILGKAGGITNNANPKRIKIIRGNLKDPQILLLNLNDIASLKDDRLILHNKDIIYAEPKSTANINNKIGVFTTALGLGLSLINLFFVFNRL